MLTFTYGSRVIENEQQARLQRNVRRIGNLLHAVVNFCLTFFLFVLINVLLHNLVQHTQLSFVKLLNVLPESIELLVSNSAVSVMSFVNQHSLFVMLAFAFTYEYHFDFVLKTLATGDDTCAVEQETYHKDNQQSYTQSVHTAISYRYKVCFLS